MAEKQPDNLGGEASDIESDSAPLVYVDGQPVPEDYSDSFIFRVAIETARGLRNYPLRERPDTKHGS